MLSRKFIAFLLAIIKVAVSQTVYPTTAVKYSTNSVPTVQTYPVSTATVSGVPAAVAAATIASATTMPSAITATAIPATCATTASLAPSMSPTVTVKATPIPASTAKVIASQPSTVSSPTVTVSPMPAKTKGPTEPKAYFLPANIPDPKVTIISTDLPDFVEVKPILLEDPEFIQVKSTSCPNHSATPALKRKDTGPMTAVKRVTMACTDDVPFVNEDTLCPGITKIDATPTPFACKNSKSNPIDFDGLFESFMTCL